MFRLTSGYFEGSVIEEGVRILDVGFFDLEQPIQDEIIRWAEEEKQFIIGVGKNVYGSGNGGRQFTIGADKKVYGLENGETVVKSIDEIVKAYEDSWEYEEELEAQDPDLVPVSEW